MKLNKKRLASAALCSVFLLQILALFLFSAPGYVYVASISTQILIVLLMLWFDVRTGQRHEQLVKRIARASTRPEVNELKWQLEARDAKNQRDLMNELQRIDRNLASRTVDSTKLIKRIEQALSDSPTGTHKSTRIDALDDGLRRLAEDLQNLETSPRLRTALWEIRQIHEQNRQVSAELQAVKYLVNETLIEKDFGLS